MSDEKSGVPETLESLGERIATLAKSMETRFAEAKTHLDVRVEALDAKITLVYDTVIAQNGRNKANNKAHTRFEQRLDDHDTRILRLESPKRSSS